MSLSALARGYLFIGIMLPGFAQAQSDDQALLEVFGQRSRQLSSQQPINNQPARVTNPPAANNKAVAGELAALKKQIATQQQVIKQQQAMIASLKRSTPSAKRKVADPQSDIQRDSYSLGQSIAANAQGQLKLIDDAGITLDRDQLGQGILSGLQMTSALSSHETATRFQALEKRVSQMLPEKITAAYQQLDKQTVGQQPISNTHGIRWFTRYSVNNRLQPEQKVAVQVIVKTRDDKIINDFSDDNVTFNAQLPALMYEAMSLTGKGGGVEGWALAKDIADREPLPAWIAPYELIHYILSIK